VRAGRIAGLGEGDSIGGLEDAARSNQVGHQQGPAWLRAQTGSVGRWLVGMFLS